MIGRVQGDTEGVVQSMHGSSQRVAANPVAREQAGIALAEITRAMEQIHERNLVIASASEEQAAVAREVDRNLLNIRDLSLQTPTPRPAPVLPARSCRNWRRACKTWWCASGSERPQRRLCCQAAARPLQQITAIPSTVVRVGVWENSTSPADRQTRSGGN
jgi:hypothetical protein